MSASSSLRHERVHLILELTSPGAGQLGPRRLSRPPPVRSLAIRQKKRLARPSSPAEHPQAPSPSKAPTIYSQSSTAESPDPSGRGLLGGLLVARPAPMH
ncbi:unnamed protein product [Urochloa humidicola]